MGPRAVYLPTQVCSNLTVTAVSIWLVLAAVGVGVGDQRDQQIDKHSYVNSVQTVPLRQARSI